jgi:hypothetical protein
MSPGAPFVFPASVPFGSIGFFPFWTSYKFFNVACQVVIFNVVSMLIGFNSNIKAYIFLNCIFTCSC